MSIQSHWDIAANTTRMLGSSLYSDLGGAGCGDTRPRPRPLATRRPGGIAEGAWRTLRPGCLAKDRALCFRCNVLRCATKPPNALHFPATSAHANMFSCVMAPAAAGASPRRRTYSRSKRRILCGKPAKCLGPRPRQHTLDRCTRIIPRRGAHSCCVGNLL